MACASDPRRRGNPSRHVTHIFRNPIMKSRAIMLIAGACAVVGGTPVAGAAQDGASPRLRNVRLSTGVRLHYAEQGDSASTSEPIILLHGLSDSWFSFSLVLPLLSAQHRVY